MNAERVFFDTNILLYCFDLVDPGKRHVAHELVMEMGAAAAGVISYQVEQEFTAVAIRKIRDKVEIRRRLEGMAFLAMGMRIVHSSEPIFNRAISLWEHYSLAWYDSLIVA